MEKDAGLLAEALAMVRCDDQPRRIEHAAALKLVEQQAQLFVQIRDAVVIGVAGERGLLHGERGLVHRLPLLDEIDLAVGARPYRETVNAPFLQRVRIVDIVVIHEGEERPLRLPATR